MSFLPFTRPTLDEETIAGVHADGPAALFAACERAVKEQPDRLETS